MIIKIKGTVRLICKDKNGNLKWDTNWLKNTITYTGKAAVAGLTGNTGAITAFTYLAVGSDATAESASQTALIAEISINSLGRHAATVTRDNTGGQTNDTLVLTYTWTASGSSTINEIGVFNDPTTGIMLGRKLTGAKSVASTDTLAATYKITFA